MARGKEDRGEVMVFVVRSRVDGKDKTMICSHCKRSRQDANFCFALIGYLKCWGDRPCTDGKNGGHGRDRNPRYSEQKKGKAQTVVLCGSMQPRPYLEAQP